MSENMRSGDTPSETRILAAAVLEDRFEEIFEDYERRLYDINSLLVVGEGSARERYRSQASSLLERAARILRGEESSLVTVEEEVYRNIEAAREPLNPHPDEAFRAGIALCTAALAAVGENLPSNSSLREVVGVCLVIEEAAVDRLSRVVTASQVDYLLTKIRETQSEERRRFSRELHDRLAHSMATVKGSLELYETLKERDPARAEARLRLAQQTTDEAIELMRKFSRELRGTET